MIERCLKIRRITTVILILMVFIPSAVFSLGNAEGSQEAKINSNPLVAETPYGTYTGVRENGIITFKGIPYGVAERWQEADFPPESSENFLADTYGDIPIQNPNIFRGANEFAGSNDCLNVNIWTADNDLANKSVYMYVYGGAQIMGSNRAPDWSKFVEENPDIIVVMPNYRVGFWGSMDLSQLDGYDENLYNKSNNLTRVDLLHCLKWINQNIEAFGGNPEDVAIGGQSAGSNNVTCLLMMEESHQYFQKAICQSSFSADISIQPIENSKLIANDVFDRLGVSTMDELLAVSDGDLMAVQTAIFLSSASGSSAYSSIEEKSFSPVIDGVVLKDDYYTNLLNGSCEGIAVMFGTNNGEYDQQYLNRADRTPLSAEDALNFTVAQNWGKLSERGWNAENGKKIIDEFYSHNELYGRDDYTAARDLKNDLYLRCGAIMYANALSEYTDVYMYYNEFDTTTHDPIRTSHGSEIRVVARDWSGLTDLFAEDPKAEATAGMLSNTWAEFIRTGNPNNDSLSVEWTKYNNDTRDTLIIANDPEVVNGVRNEDVDLVFPLMKEYPLLETALFEKVSDLGVYEGFSAAYYNGYNRYSVYVPVDDGTKLAVDYYIPTKNGVETSTPLPVVWEFTPYNRVRYSRDGDGSLSIDASVPWFTSYGYVVARADVRGMGASYGVRETVNSRREAQDGHDITEWLAAQPWSNGKVGMFGMSYTGATQLETISTEPEHLVCAVVGMTDYNKYDGWFRGGIPRAFGHNPDTQWAVNGGNVTIQSVVDATVPVDEDGDSSMLYEAVSQHVKNGEQVPVFKELLWRDSYYDAVNGEDWNIISASTYKNEINDSGVAMYLLGGLYDVFRRDTFTIYENLSVPKKMTIGSWYHILPKLNPNWEVEQLRWYDYHLKGIDNGVMTEAPIAVKTEHADVEWGFYEEWPAGEGSSETYYLTEGTSGTAASVNDDLLSEKKNSTNDYIDYKAVYGIKTAVEMTPSTDLDAKGLTFTSLPMTGDLEITGHPMANINFELLSEGYDDIDIFVTLVDYDPATGEGFVVSDGHLRASLRSTTDAAYDFLGLPWHRGNQEDIDNIKTGEVYELEIDMMPTSYVIEKGHCLRVSVSNAMDRFHYLGRTEYEANPDNYSSPTMRLYTGGKNASSIVLPNIYN